MSDSKNQLFSLLFALVAIGGIVRVTDAKPPSRVSGGSDAAPGAFPYVVSIAIKHGYWNPSHICGGGIISSRHVITAAHCVGDKVNWPSQLVVRGGVTNLQDRKAVEVRVQKIILSPNYISQIPLQRAIQNDIAILELEKELDLGDKLTKLSVPKSMPENHQRATIAGWGHISEIPKVVRTHQLQYDEVEFLDDNACRKHSRPILPQFFCGLQDNGNILSGDSGSPLVSNGEVIGVVSSGWGVPGVPDSYTNVYHYRDWINSVIN